MLIFFLFEQGKQGLCRARGGQRQARSDADCKLAGSGMLPCPGKFSGAKGRALWSRERRHGNWIGNTKNDF